jgi:hypothetical protein
MGACLGGNLSPLRFVSSDVMIIHEEKALTENKGC